MKPLETKEYKNTKKPKTTKNETPRKLKKKTKYPIKSENQKK